jgi:hypothetical protein
MLSSPLMPTVKEVELGSVLLSPNDAREIFGNIKGELRPALAHNTKLILVADQDNKLQHRISVDPTDDASKFITAVITRFSFDAVILSASANNEGWDRRNWANRVVQAAEPVPTEAAKELFPMAFTNDTLREYVEGHLSGYPLCWGMAEKAAVSPDALTALQNGVDERVLSVWQRYDAILTKPEHVLKFNSLLHTRGVLMTAPYVYERNLLEVHGDATTGFLLKPIFAKALDLLRAHFSLRHDALLHFDDAMGFELSVLTILGCALVWPNQVGKCKSCM